MMMDTRILSCTTPIQPHNEVIPPHECKLIHE
uniref:Uncharacterized protein n=1 Tax=Arundo donax TaxID=35708 RepID=A0A0A9CAX9_ARUDO